MFIIKFIARILVLIGAFNWGSIGLFNYNFVAALLGGMPATDVMGVERVIYILVGIAAIVCLIFCCKGSGCCCKLCREKKCPCCCGDKSKKHECDASCSKEHKHHRE